MTSYTKDLNPGEVVSLLHSNSEYWIFVVAIVNDDSNNLSPSGSWTRVYGFYCDRYMKPTTKYADCGYTSSTMWVVH